MARHSLSDYFSKQHLCSRKEMDKAIIAAVTGTERRAVLAMFRAWYPSNNSSHVAFKRIALSKPEPLTPGRINPNVTEKRRELEALAHGDWKGYKSERVKSAEQRVQHFMQAVSPVENKNSLTRDELIIPPMPPVPQQEIPLWQFRARPKPYVPRKPKPKPEPKAQAQTTNESANDEEEEWMEV